MGDASVASGQNGSNSTSVNGKKHILINAFDMYTVGHLSPGQWKVSCADVIERRIELIGCFLPEPQRQIGYKEQPRVLD
jgi:hypothetical protein